MNMKRIACREHGGTFEIVAKRGRPPVRCTEDNPCSGVNVTDGRNGLIGKKTRKLPNEPYGTNAVSRPERVASEIKNRNLTKAVERAYDDEAAAKRKEAISKCGKYRGSAAQISKHETGCKACALIYAGRAHDPSPNGASVSVDTARDRAKAHAKAIATLNPCVSLAYAARERLEPLGWAVTARGWMDGDSSFASLTASRDTELLSLYWQDGVLTDQEYNLWNTELPSANGKPKGTDSFLPEFDEMTDKEVVQRLSGMTVQWWNSLGQSVERATIGEKIKITHAYSGTGDEVPRDRVINFVDHENAGYRAFRLGALMKLGRGR
ncbi:MAG TPA: hypothetical protein VIY48_00345 [Candidatus Paceibacterota bacterium]